MISSINDSAQELHENVPLRKTEKKRKTFANWFDCSLGNIKYTICFSGLGLFYTSLVIFSFVITSVLFMQIYYGAFQIELHGTVASDNSECSVIGVNVLRKGGNSVDAAVAAAICMAVVNPHTTGLAAGGAFMIYSHRLRNLPDVVDFGPIVKLETDNLPRLIIGLAYTHHFFGKLPWNVLLRPSIELARNGFSVSKALTTAINISETYHLFNHPEFGQKLQLPKLAHTLETIANLSEDRLDSVVRANYNMSKTSATNTTFLKHNIYIPNIAGSQPALITALNYLFKYNMSMDDFGTADYFYNIADVMTTTYKELGISTRPYEATVSTVVATDIDDLYAAVVVGLNEMLGSRNMSADGYLIDNLPVPTNNPETALPVIITDATHVCGKRVLFGTGDNSLALQIIGALIIGRQNITESIEMPRFRVLNEKEIGVEVTHEPTFSDDIITKLHSLGNVIALSEPYDSVNVIRIIGDHADTASDSRGGGSPSQF